MRYEDLAQDNDFHKWHSYEPFSEKYKKYKDSAPAVLAAGHKIVDVYNSFADGRATYMYAYSPELEKVAGNDEFDKLFCKSQLLRHAVLDYALCLDISLQVVWAYIQPDSLDCYIANDYEKMEKSVLV